MSVSKGAVGTGLLGVGEGDTVSLSFADDGKHSGKTHMVDGKKVGSITKADIHIGKQLSDGGHAIETHFHRREVKKQKLWSLLKDYLEDFYARYLVMPDPPEDDWPEEDKAEVKADMSKVQMTRYACLAFVVLPLLAFLIPLSVRILRGTLKTITGLASPPPPPPPPSSLDRLFGLVQSSGFAAVWLAQSFGSLASFGSLSSLKPRVNGTLLLLLLVCGLLLLICIKSCGKFFAAPAKRGRQGRESGWKMTLRDGKKFKA